MKSYKRLFANKYDSFTNNLEEDLAAYRKKLIQPLHGKILDVGAGTGANFKYFKSNTEVIGIDPSEFMLNKAKEKYKNLENIQCYNLGVNDEKLSAIIESNSLDYIVCTLVLCTIPNPKLALNNFSKWLKPQGKLVVLEHIHSAKPINRFLQNTINPIWKVVGDGCHLNRNTDALLKASNFELESEEYFKRTLRFYAAIYKKI